MCKPTEVESTPSSKDPSNVTHGMFSAFMTWSFAVAQVIPINSPGPAGLTQKGLPVRVAYSEMEKFPKILRLKIARNSR
jgi:hypothetical protein